MTLKLQTDPIPQRTRRIQFGPKTADASTQCDFPHCCKCNTQPETTESVSTVEHTDATSQPLNNAASISGDRESDGESDTETVVNEEPDSDYNPDEDMEESEDEQDFDDEMETTNYKIETTENPEDEKHY